MIKNKYPKDTIATSNKQISNKSLVVFTYFIPLIVVIIVSSISHLISLLGGVLSNNSEYKIIDLFKTSPIEICDSSEILTSML